MASAGEKYTGFSTGFSGLFNEEGVRKKLHHTATRAMTYMITQAANNSLAAGTWKSYKPVLKHLEECQEYLECHFNEDPSEEDAVSFVAYLATVKEHRADTISKMLSAWRMVCITLGRKAGNLRPVLVTQVLKGLRHREEETGQKRSVRQVVTVTVLKLLRMLLLKKNKPGWTSRKRRTLWAASLLNFWGAFRGSEIFARNGRWVTTGKKVDPFSPPFSENQ